MAAPRITNSAGGWRGTGWCGSTERFSGYGWQTAEDTLLLRLDRADVPDAYYVEMINIAPDRQARARIWQWFQHGRPWKRTCCDEWRIEP
jgi:hypothetical protein